MQYLSAWLFRKYNLSISFIRFLKKKFIYFFGKGGVQYKVFKFVILQSV